MLMLDSEQVEYRKVTGYVDDREKTTSGLIYQGNIFTLAKSFDRSELQQAIKECREEYLDHEERTLIPTLLVKDTNSVGIWMRDDRYRISQEANGDVATAQETPQNAAKLDKISVRQLALEMRAEKGVEIKTRRQKLKLYQRCFVGSEAVDWIVKKYDVSRADAVSLGQKLIDKKIAHHITDEEKFEDKELYYRFYEDEGKSIWTDKIV